MRVNVPVTTLWVGPDKPRSVDAPAIADSPDMDAWLAALDEHRGDTEDGDGRLGLHARVDTQLLAGEPVLVTSAPANTPGWVHVVCPWQPSELDPRGYPGWLRRAHLISDDTQSSSEGPEDESWALAADEKEQPVLALARRHLGLAYLWGGMSPLGLDCSGLVHLVHRELGQVVPRDAHTQEARATAVGPDEVQPGDLYFFAHPGKTAHHVGIVTEPGSMIHAPETGQGIVEEPLDEVRRATLTGAGRVLRSRA
jgi:cell wall-associated NlpC family hydrolase